MSTLYLTPSSFEKSKRSTPSSISSTQSLMHSGRSVLHSTPVEITEKNSPIQAQPPGFKRVYISPNNLDNSLKESEQFESKLKSITKDIRKKGQSPEEKASFMSAVMNMFDDDQDHSKDKSIVMSKEPVIPINPPSNPIAEEAEVDEKDEEADSDHYLSFDRDQEPIIIGSKVINDLLQQQLQQEQQQQSSSPSLLTWEDSLNLGLTYPIPPLSPVIKQQQQQQPSSSSPKRQLQQHYATFLTTATAAPDRLGQQQQQNSNSSNNTDYDRFPEYQQYLNFLLSIDDQLQLPQTQAQSNTNSNKQSKKREEMERFMKKFALLPREDLQRLVFTQHEELVNQGLFQGSEAII